jgi:exonuclease SbcC
MGPEAECPTCERILGKQHDVLVKKFDKDVDQRQKEIIRITQELKQKQEEYDRISREETALQKKKEYLQKLLREKERIQTILKTMAEELKREQKEQDQNKKQLTEIGPVVFNLEEYQTCRQKAEVSYKKYQSLLTDLNGSKERYTRAQVEFARKDSEKKLVLQQITNVRLLIEEQEKRQKQIQDDQKMAQYLAMLSEIMSGFRTHLISRIRPTLSTYASDFFERLTDGKYREIEVDEDYNIKIYDEGTCYPISRFSGGEEDLANLCLRLAISEVITERAGGAFNFIILDEIFGSQDMIRRQNIMKALSGLSSKFRQIFLITHIEDVKNYMEHIINVAEDNTGTSSAIIE